MLYRFNDFNHRIKSKTSRNNQTLAKATYRPSIRRPSLKLSQSKKVPPLEGCDQDYHRVGDFGVDLRSLCHQTLA